MMHRGKILGAALGNCIHVGGLKNFLNLAKQKGYSTVCLGHAIPVSRLITEIHSVNPDIVALSYRLTPENARELFAELADAIEEYHLQEKTFILGGTPPVVAVGRDIGIFEALFSGLETENEIGNYLEGVVAQIPDTAGRIEKLPDLIDHKYPTPLLRHHLGLPTRQETIEAAKRIAESGILDILSIAPDQNAQEHFFNPGLMDHKLDGAGGVPLRKPDDLEALYAVTRCGNYPLLRCYAGTRNLVEWASMLLQTINVAWGAVPLCWYSQLDGRSDRPLYDAIKENQQAINWYAEHSVPVEVNESHQWALRNTSDVIEVATGFLASYNAKQLGVRWYIMQYMFNTPPGTSPQMDLAKMLAKLELIEKLEDDSFTCYRMVRTGLASLSPDPAIAKGQLASSITIASALQPHIVHVVGYTEGDHAITADEIIESCKIARGVIENLKTGFPDLCSDERIQVRKNQLVSDATALLQAMTALADDNIADPLVDPRILTLAIRNGLLDAPHLEGNICAKGSLETRIMNGASNAIEVSTGRQLSEIDRIRRILEATN